MWTKTIEIDFITNKTLFYPENSEAKQLRENFVTKLKNSFKNPVKIDISFMEAHIYILLQLLIC